MIVTSFKKIYVSVWNIKIRGRLLGHGHKHDIIKQITPAVYSNRGEWLPSIDTGRSFHA